MNLGLLEEAVGNEYSKIYKIHIRISQIVNKRVCSKGFSLKILLRTKLSSVKST